MLFAYTMTFDISGRNGLNGLKRIKSLEPPQKIPKTSGDHWRKRSTRLMSRNGAGSRKICGRPAKSAPSKASIAGGLWIISGFVRLYTRREALWYVSISGNRLIDWIFSSYCKYPVWYGFAQTHFLKSMICGKGLVFEIGEMVTTPEYKLGFVTRAHIAWKW